MLYVIATPRFDAAGHYRTRYYLECRDGRPRFGDKANACRLTVEEAASVLGQLRIIAPQHPVKALDDTAHPDRHAWDGIDAPHAPTQMDIE